MNEVHDRLRKALFGKYTVEHEIGRGGMAYVFLARDLKYQRQVALKVLRPELAASVGSERFLREIEIEASLHHPHILPLYDSGEAGDLLYYSMPYVEGETLREKLRRETQLDVDEALRIASEVADAVAHAHTQNVVHRDIKPENILLSDGHALVADFGVARALSAAGGEQITDSGMAVGTPAYMSPEQAFASSTIDFRSDVYSLGLVVYEMLAGEPPFTGPTPVAVLARHASERVPSLQIVRPNVPSGVVTAVETALEKVPADRYQTAAAFGDALRSGVDSEVLPATSRSIHSRRPLIGAVAFIAVAALAAVWFLFLQPETLDPDSVMVFPLEVSGLTAPQDAELGEDNAFLIWNALDGRGSFKWINAMNRVEDPGDLSRTSGRRRTALARSAGAAFYLFGRTLKEGAGWHTYLTLHDVEGDSVVARAEASGGVAQARILGVRAVGQLLVEFLPEETVDVSAIAGTDAEAVQAFVQAERHFHGGRFVQAFDHYSEAVALDSSFALAAVKAAQAASWNHDVESANDLVAAALEHSETLTPKHLYFAKGIDHFLHNNADSAVFHFERALAIDGEWTEAWTGLGEVYTHLLPEKAPQDSLGRDAFRRVYENTSGSAPALYHLVEYAIRGRDLGLARGLMEQYRASSPDTAGYALPKLELMFRCAGSGPSAINWGERARENIDAVAQAARSLGVGGAYVGCALSAWRAVRAQSPAASPWRFGAWTGLQSLLVARGLDAELEALLDTTTEFGTTPKLYSIVDALAGANLTAMADSVAGSLRSEISQLSPFRLWVLGVWEAHTGRVDEARAIRNTLSAWDAGLVTRSLTAHIAAATGDTALAIQQLSSLGPSAARSSLIYPWESLGLEKLLLARLLLAQGQAADAYRVASTIDAPGAVNLIYPVFLPASLEIRREAARFLDDFAAVREIDARIHSLRQ